MMSNVTLDWQLVVWTSAAVVIVNSSLLPFVGKKVVVLSELSS